MISRRLSIRASALLAFSALSLLVACDPGLDAEADNTRPVETRAALITGSPATLLNPGDGASVSNCGVELTWQFPTGKCPTAQVYLNGKAVGSPVTAARGWTDASTEPLNRNYSAFAFDSFRRKALLFGGFGEVPLNDTWELDVDTWKWTRVTLASPAPPTRYGHSMVFDLARRRFIVWGGVTTDTTGPTDVWEYDPDGATWTRVAAASGSSNTPSARAYGQMVYDAVRGKAMYYGGLVASTSANTNDLWEYDPAARSWQKVVVASPSEPTPRRGHGLVFDPNRSRLILFGGLVASGLSNETWEYDVATRAWEPIAPEAGVAPSGRQTHAMAFDPVRKLAIVFGGAVGGSTFLNDIWTYDIVTKAWLQKAASTPSKPALRADAMMTFDPTTETALVLGGSASGFTAQFRQMWADLWAYSVVDDTWTLRTGGRPVSPGARSGSAVGHDPDSGLTYFFGGRGVAGGVDNQFWQYNASAGTWTELTPATRPSARTAATMTYDSVRKRLVLFGGWNSTSNTLFNDTWEFDPATQTWAQLTTTGTPSARRYASLVYDANRQRAVLFGGLSASAYLSDVWELNLTTRAWTALASSSNPLPAGRMAAGFAYDPLAQKYVLVGGTEGTRAFGDSWEFTASTRVWVQTATGTGQAPPARMYHTAVYHPVRQKVVLFGGSAFPLGSGAPALAGDLYAYDASNTKTWSVVAAADSTTPPTREDSSVWYDTGTDALMFAFGNNSAPFNDVWALADDAFATGRVLVRATATTNQWYVATTDTCNGVTSPVNSATRSFTIDSVGVIAPLAPSITSPVDGAQNLSCQPTLTWANNDPDSNLTWDVELADGTVLARDLNVLSWSFPNDGRLANGNYSARIVARNCAGKTAASNFTNFTVNNNPLAPTITAPSDGALLTATPTLAWSDPPGQRPFTTYSVYLDNFPSPVATKVAGTNGGYTYTPTTPLIDGAHTYRIVATGCQGETASTSVSFTIDSSAPTAFTKTTLIASATSATLTPTLCWTPSSDAGSGLTGYTLTLTGPVGGPTNVPLLPSASCWTAPAPLAAGRYQWNVAARDTAGNTTGADNNTTAIFFAAPDTLAPTLAITTPASNPPPQLCVAIPFAGTATDFGPDVSGPVGSDVKAVEWRPSSTLPWQPANIDPVEGVAYPWHFTWTAPTSGFYKIEVRATDNDNNAVIQSRAVTIDCDPPTDLALLNPINDAYTTSKPTLRWTDAVDLVTGIAGYSVSLNSGVKISVGVATAYTVPSTLPDGRYTWQVFAADLVGNETPSAVGSFIVDTTPPSAASVTAPAAQACVDPITASFTWSGCTDAVSGVASARITLDGNEIYNLAAGSGGTLSLPSAALTPGTHALQVTCTDNVGLVTAGPTLQFRVNDQKPTCEFIEARRRTDQDGHEEVAFTVADPTGCGIASVSVRLGETDITPTRGTGNNYLAKFPMPEAGGEDPAPSFTCTVTLVGGAQLTTDAFTIPRRVCEEAGPCDKTTLECIKKSAAASACDDLDACTPISTCDGTGRCLGAGDSCTPETTTDGETAGAEDAGDTGDTGRTDGTDGTGNTDSADSTGTGPGGGDDDDDATTTDSTTSGNSDGGPGGPSDGGDDDDDDGTVGGPGSPDDTGGTGSTGDGSDSTGETGGTAATDGIGVTAGDGPGGDDDDGGEGGGCVARAPTDSGIVLGLLTVLGALGAVPGLRRRRRPDPRRTD